MKMNKKGFTLIEMLVVIAIIAVLVSIIIPTVSSATEKAKEAADVANIRSAIAEVSTAGLTGEGSTAAKTVTMKQKQAGFVSEDLKSIGGVDATTFSSISNATEGTVITIEWDDTATAVKVTVGSAGTTTPSTPAPSEP